MGAAFATTLRPLRALGATTIDAGLENAPAKADVRAEEARRKEARTRAACAAGATATAERVTMVLVDTGCDFKCPWCTRSRASGAHVREVGRFVSSALDRGVRPTRPPGVFDRKRRQITSDLDPILTYHDPNATNDIVFSRNRTSPIGGKRRLETRSTCVRFFPGNDATASFADAKRANRERRRLGFSIDRN